MLKIAIIDDEKNVRIVIKKLLTLVNIEHRIVGEAANIKDAKEVILETKPDIVLLDIKLEDGSGFDLLNQLDAYDFKLIFITAYNEFAIRSFKFNALDYLLKPINPEELKNAIDRASKIIDSDAELRSLLTNRDDNETKEPSQQKLVIKTNQKTHFIQIEDIVYIQSDGSYAKIYSKEKVLLASKNLKFFQDLLPEDQFIRIHKSYLINKKCVININGNIVSLINNYELPISTRKRTEIIKLLK